ncbi:MAG: hypothetical protein A4E58_01897 [Syntrophorhabdus sp. PtaB.Bin006]|nr:MAG: hypothetical protein A4E58_01897 [Syntrophorhabdus sp. PtaB.Bin006]
MLTAKIGVRSQMDGSGGIYVCSLQKRFIHKFYGMDINDKTMRRGSWQTNQ